MSKNVIHNFNLSIQNSTDIKSSEHLTETIIKELAKVSKEMSQQKDIVQEWQEQKNQNAAAFANNSSSLTEGGATDTNVETIKKTAMSISNTPLVSGETMANFNLSTGLTIPTSSALIGGGVTDTTGRTRMSSATSDNTTPPTAGAENNTVNLTNSTTTQTYANVEAQQILTVPQMLQTNSNEPSIEVIKAQIKKKLETAVIANNTVEIEYWKNISKAFEEGATAQDFDGKPNDIWFTQMYYLLKQPNLSIIENQNFNWEIVREKMIKSIDTNILSGTISDESKKRWTTIKQQLNNDKVNIANLFEQYDELFLLLKEVEGLDALPNTITITTKTKIYPNLSADRFYANIGKEDVYVFLKEVSNEEIRGSAVDKGAVKIKNTAAKSFIVGESLEFFLDENFINQNLYKKENINWIVRNIKNKKDEGTIFKNEGISLSYNFDAAGVYRIDAYGYKPTIKGNKNAMTSTFIELEIIAQQIEIKSPFKDSVTRASVKEQLFKVALKNPKIKTLNPLKFYYQLETKTANKVTKISEELELDATGIIKLAMPDLGEYKIKVTSKDQYALAQESIISVIKNEVTSIGLAEKTSNNNVFLLGDLSKTITLEAKSFKINPATDNEKEDVRWMVYDSNNKPYITPETVLFTDKKDPQKEYIHKWKSFSIPIPQKAGHYTVEAFSDRQKGAKKECIYKIEVKHPQVTEACWAWSGGSKKVTSGFSGESNYIKAQIPYYENQSVRVYFYLNNAKTNHYIDAKTNEKGEIFEEVKFDSGFQKEIGFKSGENAKIGFKLLGIQNSKPYPFKAPANYESDTVLSVTTDVKILDAYFMYDGNRVKAEDQIPFDKKGTTISIVAKTQNMVGGNIILTAHKVGEKPAFSNETKVSSEGVAIISFVIMPAKELKKGIVNKYYVGIEGYSTKHLTDKMINMVVGNVVSKKNEEAGKYGIDIPYFLRKYKGENEVNLKVLLNEMNEYYTSEKIIPRKEQVAYLLATVYTETFKTFKPIIESFWITDKRIREETYHRYDPILADSDKRRKTAVERGNTTEGDGVKYCGRGYVQLTWKKNYKKIKNQFGIDVVNYPDKVLEPKLATKIMIWGMDNGIFTGVSINNYINSSKTDYVNARKVINGTDRDKLIANDAEKFEKDLKIIKSKETLKSKSLNTALEEMKVIADQHLQYDMEENTGKSEGLRTSLNDAALKKMDCSEFVCRYLHKLGITKEVKWVTTASMTSESSFQKALGTDKIKFVGNSKDFKPQAGDVFVWRNGGGGHTGIVYKYDSTNDLVTILEAIGQSGSRDNDTNKKNGGYPLANCTRTSVYKSKGEALFAHQGFIGYFRPQKL